MKTVFGLIVCIGGAFAILCVLAEFASVVSHMH
jgi:hypothetical protein